MIKKMPVPEGHHGTVVIAEQPPYAILVMSPSVYDALQAAIEVAFEDPNDVPLEYKEGATVLWAAFHDG